MDNILERKVVPSYPAPSFKKLAWLFDSLQGVTDEIQVDIVDDQFAPFCAWPFTMDDPERSFAELSPYTQDFVVEMDCMIQKPERFLDLFVTLGVKRVIVHLRSTEQYQEIINHARTHGYVIGFALVNDVPLYELEPYIERLDFVQLMGIKEIGQQGQPFDERTLSRAKELRSAYPELTIAVDGSVNRETIPKLLAAGVNRFAPGSAITKATDPAAAFLELSDMLR